MNGKIFRTFRTPDVPSVIAVLLGVGCAVVLYIKPFLISSWLPRYEWLYLAALISLLIGSFMMYRKGGLDSSYELIIFLTCAPLCAVALFVLFLFFRVDRQRLEILGARARATQDYRIRPSTPSSGNSPVQFVPVGSLYQLSFSYPPAIFLNEDAEIELSNVYLSPEILAALKPTLTEPLTPELGGLSEGLRRSLKVQGIDATVELSSRSFLIDPSGPMKFPLVGGTNLRFVISPQKLGVRKILVRSNINPGVIKALEGVAHFDHQDLTLSINVMPEKEVLGLTGAQLQFIQIITSAIGFPALALAGLTILREARRGKTEGRAARRRSQKK